MFVLIGPKLRDGHRRTLFEFGHGANVDVRAGKIRAQTAAVRVGHPERFLGRLVTRRIFAARKVLGDAEDELGLFTPSTSDV